MPMIDRSAFNPRLAAQADHYFATVHGDVAALQARIERGFADYPFERAPASIAFGRVEQTIESTSRIAGVLGLIGALTAMAYLLI